MKITRRFTKANQDVFSTVEYEKRTSRITNPDGTVVFEMTDAEMPRQWSQLATDIMVSKYFRKAGVPQVDESGTPLRDEAGKPVTGPERSAKQVVNRLAGCWRHWGETHGYFDSTEDAQAFYDELSYMLLHQMCAPNSPQWFNTGLNFAYGITGPAQGHFYCDPKTGEMQRGKDAYTHPQPHACQPFRAPVSTPNGPMQIGKIVTENMVGLEVFDGTDDGLGTTRVVAVKSNGQKEVFRVVVEGGATVEATADHLVYAMASDELTGRWVRVDSLERGMKLVRSIRDKQAEANIEKSAGAAATALKLRTLKQVAVQRIEPIGIHAVYDIQTESGQYLSNNIIVHNCFIQSVSDDLVNPGGIMDLWTREARLFKYGSGTGSNFSKLRGENEPLSGGGKSSGLMSFLKIGDRAAGAIKSGGTTRRAAKMVCLDLDHPDIEDFVNWKVREEIKVACLAEGIKHIAKEHQETAKKLGLKLDYDFNGEAYMTVSGQNSNNSVRIPNSFFKAVEEDGDWKLMSRTHPGKVRETLKARKLWDEIAYAAWRCADPGVQYDDTINQWHTCPKSGRINASNPCVTGDTRVLTPGGIWRRIDQMIHLPARIVTNLDSQETRITEGAFPTGLRDVLELRTQGGYALKLTPDHKVYTRNRGWVEAKDLTTSDFVRLPGKHAAHSQIGEPQDHRFFQLLGLLLSEGNASTSELRPAACVDAATAEVFSDYVTQNWTGRDADDINELESTGGTAIARVGNRRLISRLRAFVRNDSAMHSLRRLSDDAFTAGLAAQKHLLRALFTADGVLVGDTIELQSTSAFLLQDVQTLLLGFGVQSALRDMATRRDFTPDQADRLREYFATINQNSSTIELDGGAVANGVEPSRQDATEHGSSTGSRTSRGHAAPRHGLRIDPGSLRSFCKHVALLPGIKLEQLATASSRAIAKDDDAPNHDRVATLTPIGRHQVFDLTEPVTHSFVANGMTIHNCSEYMFLDDTACNLASLNVLTFFDAETRRFDIEGFKHGIRLWTTVLEISVLMASFPSEEIAKLSYRYRTLGLGYANLGAMLMQAGIPYDSEKGRALCAAISAILTGESYATSADLARELGAFEGFDENRAEMLRVIRNHRRAVANVTANPSAARGLGSYENLDILPVGMDHAQFDSADPLASKALCNAAIECWDRALFLGERHGYRNAQTTVIAPTGTIGLLMDCDTTGVEPDFALVKFKKLAGGGYFKIANQSLRPSLVNLGYTPEQIHDILKFVLGAMTFDGAPQINADRLKALGFTAAELEKIEATLPGQFEISFAFSPWSLSPETFTRLGITETEWQMPGFNLLTRLGFTRKQINEANDFICGRGTVEGAPHLKVDHLPVFDCANKCGKTGVRFIRAEGHIRMMAAAQPFITGAISKTINLPNEATLDEIKQSYQLSWELGLKANALYRDGSKLSQPLNVKSDEELDDAEEDDEENVAAAKEELVRDVAKAISSVERGMSIVESADHSSHNRQSTVDGPRGNVDPVHTSIIEKIVERIVERPLRRRLPDTRHAVTHKFDISGHEGYITVGLYEDGAPGEVFITMAKEGSTIGGLMDTIATLVSVSLQYGVGVDSLVRKFEHVRFEPSGMTRNREIPFAKSLVDYIFRWLAMEFVPGYRAANAPKRDAAPVRPGSAPIMKEVGENTAPEKDSNGHGKKTNGHGPGNGHSRIEIDAAAVSKDADYEDKPNEEGTLSQHVATTTRLRAAVGANPLSQQGTELQSDAPACDVCGSITIRSGTCYKCQNCGNSMGCS